jgi:predicted esterase
MIITTNSSENIEQVVETIKTPIVKKTNRSFNVSQTLIKKISMFFLSVLALFILATVLVTTLVNGQIFANTISWSKILPVFENSQRGSSLTFLKLPVNKTKFSMLEIQSGATENAILYLHGNAGRLEHFYDDLLQMGSVYSPSYPGFSESEGSPTMENAYETAMESYKYLVEVKKIPEDKIIIFGHSLGGSVATYLASKKEKASRLVIVNTFSSIQSMCFRTANVLCGLTWGTFNSAENAKNVKIPVTQFAYKGDTTIPFAEGEKLHTYFSSVEQNKKKFVETNNYAHSHPDFDLIKKELEPFLTPIIAPKTQQ